MQQELRVLLAQRHVGAESVPWSTLLITSYTHSGCLQPGHNARNSTLDNLPEDCLSHLTCNWSPHRTETACMATYRSPFFCGSCANGFCEDLTFPALCYNPFLTGNSDSQTLCTLSGGVYSPDDLDILCYFPNHTSQEDCLPSAFCNVKVPSCEPFCYFDNINSSECNCQSQQHLFCSLLVYKEQLQLCVIQETLYNSSLRAPRSPVECNMVGGMWFYGMAWQQPHFETEANCPFGQCKLDPLLSKVGLPIPNI